MRRSFQLVLRLTLLIARTVAWQLPQLSVIKQRELTSSITLKSAVTASSVTESNYSHDASLQAMTTMIPLSNPPLLLLQSTSPIISKEDCDLLSAYFEQQDTTPESTHYPILDQYQMIHAEALLDHVRNVIDKVTNCPSHADEMQVPRYVRYNAKCTSLDMFNSPDFCNVLLPDGLHVDTNNGKLFRHITAILYLTDNDGFVHNESRAGYGSRCDESSFVVGGGTTFPLAVPFGSDISVDTTAASSLLSRGIHHTKAGICDSVESDGRQLEKSSLDLFYRDTGTYFDATKSGIRVMPRAGKLIYFHNIGDDGRPDPTSFHGGEELVAILPSQTGLDLAIFEHKSILVFFKEVPVEKVTDFNSFATEVQHARGWTLKTHYS